MAERKTLNDVVRKHVLRNAFDYGKADAKSVVGKVIAELPEAKKDFKGTLKLIEETADEVNALPKNELERELKAYSFPEKKVEEDKKLVLEGAARGKVVTRFLPEPNGFLHLGHAKAALLSWEAAQAYKGKCLLRFDDTNPETEREEFAKPIEEDLGWLGLKFASKGFSSDKMPEFVSFAEQLIEQGDAFVCACPQEKIKEQRAKKKACACRENSLEENKALWKKLVEGGEGLVLRFKGDPSSLNTVMRDPTLFRVIKKKHFRQGDKYKAWPTYDFAASVADSLDGVTHALRSKEYELRDELYRVLLERLGLRKPVVYDFSRLNIKGNALSKRLLKPLVESGKVKGWDDPRLLTLRGLKRRGVLPQAIREFVLEFGLSKVESYPSLEKLLAINKRLLEPVAEHYFFVAEPVKLVVDEAPEKIVELGKHPSEDFGVRRVRAGKEFWLSGKDAGALKKGEVFRLKDLYNVEVIQKKPLKTVFAKDQGLPSKKLQWVSCVEATPAVLWRVGDLLGKGGGFNKESLKEEKGFCEAACASLREGAVLQFERVGFARLDDEKRMWFLLSY